MQKAHTRSLIQRREIPAELPEALHLNPVLARVLAGRGVRSTEAVSYRLARMAAPTGLKDLDTAVSLLQQALQQDWHIVVVGDYDADGATSSALAVHALRHLGARADYLVPSRFSQGYGLSRPVVDQAIAQGAQLLITVDNGVSSVDAVAHARSCGVRVLITDHHLPGEVLPEADAMLNPNVQSEAFPSRALAGVGVVFYLFCALVSRLSKDPWFAESGRQLPHMPAYLDLVALGTVADVVPLDDNNRILVAQGLRRMRAGQARPGIQALLRVAGREAERLCAEDLGFYLGPRLNAAGRLESMNLGVDLLLCEDPTQALSYASELDGLNAARRALEQEMREEAERVAEGWVASQSLPAALCLYEPHWHEGIIGIVAGRLKDRYHRPVIALAKGENGLLKGSARSVEGVHLRDLLVDFDRLNPEVLQRFGGHAMAAGLTIEETQLPRLAQGFADLVAQKVGYDGVKQLVMSDGPLTEAQLDFDLIAQLRSLEPWGQGFPAPRFDALLWVQQVRWLKGLHLKMRLSFEQDGMALDAIQFNATAAPNVGERIHCVFAPSENHYQGRVSLQLMLAHWEAA